jgi:hypothetical protein
MQVTFASTLGAPTLILREEPFGSRESTQVERLAINRAILKRDARRSTHADHLLHNQCPGPQA